jgi:outer membrane protein assembly factor BamA
VAAPEQLDQDWLSQIEQTIIGDELRTQGYWRVHTEITPYLLRAAAQERFYSISAAIHSGPQYRLQEIYIANARVFPPAELRKQIPLYPGDLFDISKIRDGMDAVRSKYLSEGYIDSIWEAETSVAADHTHIKVVLKMDGGMQFRVGTVQIFGLDQKTESLLRSLLEPGQIFNVHSLHKFMKDNKSLLPPGASLAQNSQIQTNSVTGTVDIIFDFRNCPDV